MLYIGQQVYPANPAVLSDCNATRDEMERLYGIVTGVFNKQYEVTWLDIKDRQEADFDHGLKTAWWAEDELTTYEDDYNNMINDEMAPTYEMPNDDDLNEDVGYLMDDIEESIQTYADNHWDEDDYGRDEDIKDEYRQEILKRLIKRIKKEID